MDSASNAIIDLERGSSAELIERNDGGGGGGGSNSMYISPTVTRGAGISSRKESIFRRVGDWTVILGLGVIFLLLNVLLRPRISYFTCDQSDIFYPFKPDSVPVAMVIFFGIIVPVFLMALVEAAHADVLLSCCDKELDRAVHEYRMRAFRIFVAHHLSTFTLGVIVTLLLTEFGKRVFGRLRPHFMSVCNPDFTYLNCTMEVNKGAIYTPMDTGGTFCKGDPILVEEARLSFPSGHSSMAWYCMLFVCVYLERRVSAKRFRFFKVGLQIACFIGALVTSLSRISDYHHRGSDVLGGMVLGVLVACFICFVVSRVLWDIEMREKYFLVNGGGKKKSEEIDNEVNVV